MALENEVETYRTKLQQLLPQEGKYVLIHGDQVAGVWDTYEAALQAGYDRFGLNPFLVKCIEGIETVLHFSREISACPSSTSP